MVKWKSKFPIDSLKESVSPLPLALKGRPHFTKLFSWTKSLKILPNKSDFRITATSPEWELLSVAFPPTINWHQSKLLSEMKHSESFLLKIVGNPTTLTRARTPDLSTTA